MDIIHLLPDSVANQIAAGEVIQRPASCLKELVENSLDAGATRISVIVRDAGRTLLQVIDDGTGMSETDARMAFERHATSKIREAQDLFSLRTMGFRGEALASICAVAQVEVQTRREEDEMGTLLEIHGSDVVRQEPCQCPKGTNFRVKNLFYNVPARRKFLKTDQTELRNLLTEFYHIVLVYPKVQFTFVSNDEILMELPAGTEKQRIEQVFGKGNKQFTGGLVDVKTDTDLVSIRGFVGKPETSGKNAQQYFFVNGRYMRHPYFHKAIMTAYAGMLPGDYNPSYFIYFDIDPQTIDVNIHPTKTEIKFADEQAVFQILMAAVRESIGKFNVMAPIDFDRSGEIEMPVVSSTIKTNGPQVVFDPTYNPFKKQPSYGGGSGYGGVSGGGQSASYASRTAPRNWQQLYAQPEEPVVQTKTDILDDMSLLEGAEPYQYAGKYILQPSRMGLMFINQHRAHVCVQYYTILEQIRDRKGVRQQLLFPEVLDLNAADMTLMSSIVEDLQAIGFDIEQFGKNSYSIHAVPALLGQQNVLVVLQNILHALRETGASARETYEHTIALSLAKDTAIAYGKSLTREEQCDLVKRLLSLPVYRQTPDGKTVISMLSDDEISKRF